MRRKFGSLRQEKAFEYDYRIWRKCVTEQPRTPEEAPCPANYGMTDWEANHIRKQVDEEFKR